MRVRVRDGVRVRVKLLCLNSMFRFWFRLDNDHTNMRFNHSVSDTTDCLANQISVQPRSDL